MAWQWPQPPSPPRGLAQIAQRRQQARRRHRQPHLGRAQVPRVGDQSPRQQGQGVLIRVQGDQIDDVQTRRFNQAGLGELPHGQADHGAGRARRSASPEAASGRGPTGASAGSPDCDPPAGDLLWPAGSRSRRMPTRPTDRAGPSPPAGRSRSRRPNTLAFISRSPSRVAVSAEMRPSRVRSTRPWAQASRSVVQDSFRSCVCSGQGFRPNSPIQGRRTRIGVEGVAGEQCWLVQERPDQRPAGALAAGRHDDRKARRAI